MKKQFLLLMLIFCITAICTVFAEECIHEVTCDMPNVCIYCGAVDVTVSDEYILHGYGEYKNLGDQHQWLCGICGYHLEEPENHNILCDAPDRCSFCDAHDLSPADHEIYHGYAKMWVDLGEQHQQVCARCEGKAPGGIYLTREHFNYCYNPNTCIECLLSDVTIPEGKLWHDMAYVSAGAQHQYQCMECGYSDCAPEYHTGGCDEPTVCQVCGEMDVPIAAENLEHVVDWFNPSGYEITGSGHCPRCYCGQEFGEEEAHFSYCDEPTTCHICGAENVTVIPDCIEHLDMYWISLGKRCQAICYACGYTDEPRKHFTTCDYWGDRCIGCDAEVSDPEDITVSHLYGEYVDLGDVHQFQCPCGYSESAGDHQGNCIDATVCYICGKEGLTGDGRHVGWGVDLGDQHHFDCDFCDYTLDEHHWVWCDDQSACYLCGKTDFEITWENRYCLGPTTWLATTNTDHTFHCGTCEKTYTEPHHYLDGDVCSCGTVKEEREILLGDASGDGEINIMDALAVLQYAVGWDVDVYDEAADVNGDGACNILDALLILQYAVGWDVEFV